MKFTGTVQGAARNGQQITAPALTVSSAATPVAQPAAPPAPLTVSAAPFYDVMLQSINTTDAAFKGGSGPNGEDGYYHRIYVDVVARNPSGNGVKGVEQLRPDRNLEIDLNISKMPSGTQVLNWLPDRTGGFADGCGSVSGLTAVVGNIGSLINAPLSTRWRPADNGPNPSTPANQNNTVANGGECKVISSGSSNVRLELEGVDTQLNTPPTLSGTEALAAGNYWVASKALVLWTDKKHYESGRAINHEVQLASFRATSISGREANDALASNNILKYPRTYNFSGSVSKTFLADNRPSVPARSRTAADQKLGGAAVNEMAPGQQVAAQLVAANDGALAFPDLMLCDVLDRTAFDLPKGSDGLLLPANRGGIETLQTAPTGAARTAALTIRFSYGSHGAGKSPYFASTDSAADAYARAATGSSAYTQASCADPGIRWHATPQAAEADGGLVYVRGMVDELGPGERVTFHVRGLKLRDTWAADIVAFDGNGPRLAGKPIEKGSVIRNRTMLYTKDAPQLSTGRGTAFDHLQVVDSQNVTRVKKTVTHPANTSTTPVKTNSDITYRLEGRFSTVFPPQASTVTISDVLPPGMRYVHDSATVGGVLTNPVVKRDTPDTGFTTLKWAFPNRQPYEGITSRPEALLPVIEFKARVSRSVPHGARLINQALISGGSHDQEPDCVFNTANKTYDANCPKGSQAAIDVESSTGFFVEKITTTPTIQPGDDFDYTVEFLPLGKSLVAPEIPEIIDILPFNGDGQADAARGFNGRSPASRFQPGAYRLTSVTLPAADPNASIYYTNKAPTDIHNDPSNSSNRIPDGSTRWCRETEFGTAGCPANVGESTAIRIVPSFSTIPSGTQYAVELKLTTDPVIAQAGDMFANSAGFGSNVPNLALGYLQSAANLNVRIPDNVSSLSGHVFVDANQNGRRDPGEAGTANQCVSLVGTNANGQAINVSMRTDNDGNYSFRDGAAGVVFNSANCSGTALPQFGGLQDGTYAVNRVDATPAGLKDGSSLPGSAGGTAGARQITQVALGVNVRAINYNFSDVPAASSLSGRIFLDVNQNNTLENGDNGVADQCVSIGGTNVQGQQVVLSMRTDAQGNYAFREGAANTVFESADCTGNALPSFGGLLQGTYAVNRVDAPPAGQLDGAIRAGSAQGTVGTREISQITLAANTHATGYHFTDTPAMSSLSGRIFLDVNQNNTAENGDNGVAGQCVSITGTDVRGQQVAFSMRTDAGGNYSFREGAADTVFASANCTGNAQARFGGLLQGTYAVNRVDATPVEHLDGVIHAGSAQGTVGNRQITQIALAANTHATGYHFTDTPALSSLAGRIFTDANQNNLFEVGDAGVAGQCVSIQGTNVRNQAVTLSMRTDTDGHYAFVAGAPGTVFESANCTGTALPQFGGLFGGTYAVSRVDPVPAGHRGGRLYAGSLQGTVGTAQITQIVLAANTQAIDYNFTDFPLMSSLSGRIFTDRNQDGNFEAGDTGVADQCVSLTGTNRMGQQVTLSMRTDAQGHYGFKEGATDTVFESADCSGTALPSFGGLFSGEYAVSRVSNVPAGQQEGKIHAGPVGGTVGTRQITGIRIANNMEAIDYNFTDVLQIGSLSGRIYTDLDQDGQIDTGDVGVGGQCVVLRGTNVKGEKIELSMRTSADGNYAFREGATDTVFASADCSGTAMPAFDGLYQGTYAISRVDQPLAGHLDGKIYTGTPAGTVGTREITQIALGASVDGTGYDFTDIPQRPKLTLRRTVNNDDGGTATLDDVNLSADSSSTLTGEQMNIAGTPATAGGITQREMPAGVFELHHDHVAGYETGNWACVVNGTPATLSGQQLNVLTLNWGDVADCQVVYDDQRARLTLQKELDLSGRGGARANREDFTLEATRLNDAGQPGTAADDRISGVMGDADVTAKPVKAGQYLLSENLTQRQARDFNAAAWECSVQQAGQTTAGNRTTTTNNIIALSPGDQATCSVLNTNKAASFSYRNVTDVSNTSTSNGSGGSNTSSATGGGTGTSSGASGNSTGGNTGSHVRPPMPTPAIYFGRAGRPETRIDLSKVGDKAEDEIELVQGDQYEFSVGSVKGYETPKLLCRDGDGKEIPSPFTLDGQIISCDVVLVRKDTRVQLSKTVVEGYPRQVDGSVTDFDIDYLISVTHDGDSDRGKYDLFDMPDFDSRAMEDVELQRVTLVDEKGTETDVLKAVLERGQGSDGWALAREHDIDFGATHTYRVSFRVRVREDFDDTQGACTGPGTGLYNRAVLDARNDLSDPTGAGQKERLPQSDAHAACPAVPKIATSSRITIEKRSSTRSAEVGDLLTYRLVIRNRDKGIARAPMVIDRLPAGFRLEPGSVRMQKGSDTAVSVVPASRVKVVGNRVLQIQLADIPGEKNVSGSASPESMVTITYRVRLGVGSQEGDGINRAHVECPTNAARTARAQCSNEARWKVKVTDGVFSEEACVAGQVYVDCNGNSVKDREELGIPGVRLYLQNGTWMVSDEQG
ncbi:MAG: hypothetical protein Q4D19_08000, partial [Lautropia sp.]|nr:hypothetical protein [Lautropia sp.]